MCPMPAVICPSCTTHHEVDAAAGGYTCSSCGTAWSFVVCDVCGSRFHAKPGATGWRCPTCGTPHGSAAAVSGSGPMSISGDDLDTARLEVPGGPQRPGAEPDPGTSFPMPQPDRAVGIPRWAWVAVGVLVVVVAALVVVNLGGDGEPTLPAAPAGDPTEQLCAHVRELQVLRTDALGRAQQDLRADAKALEEQVDGATAKQVRGLVRAVGDLRDDLEQQQDTTKSVKAMGQAISALPCGG
jgi:hypothetical protein